MTTRRIDEDVVGLHRHFLASLRPAAFYLLHPPDHHTHLKMASALRLTGAFRAAAPLRTPAFNGLRFYSAGKTTVSGSSVHLDRLR
jgi:hypothetical protein